MLFRTATCTCGIASPPLLSQNSPNFLPSQTWSISPLEPDYRHVRNSTSSVFSTAASYSFAFSHLPDDPFAPFIWRNFAPSRCRSFLWLAHHHKLNMNFRLRSRRANNSGCCHFCGANEDIPHLFLHCPRAQSFWALLNVSSPSLTHYWAPLVNSPTGSRPP